MRLEHLVNRLLDLARAGETRPALSVAPIEARELVMQALVAMSAALDTAGIEPEVVALEGLALEADGEAVVGALIELIANAVTFASSGGRVIIETKPGPFGIVFAVRDFGPGLSSRQLRAAPLAGGGLALAGACARAHGGTLELASEPGHGLTARLVLPRRPQRG